MGNASCMQMYVKELRKIPLLTREKEIELAKKISQGDDKARETMINSHLRYVIYLAKNYLGKGISLEDLVGYGNQGLIIAVDRYNVEKDVKFISYAHYWIKQSIVRAIANFSRSIRLPVDKGDDLDRIEKIYGELSEKNGHFPCIAEISEGTGFSQEEVNYLLQISKEPISLDRKIKGDENEKSKVVGDNVESEIAGPEEEFFGVKIREDIERAFSESGISQRNREIVEKRYGLKTGICLTLEQVGKKYRITKERVRQIQNETLKEIKQAKSCQKLARYLYE